MILSKPAMISAFVCPGMGQWATGRRALGAVLMTLAVLTAGSPVARFLQALVRLPPCDVIERGIWGCSVDAWTGAWRQASPVLVVAAPLFAAIWIFAVLHANRLQLPAPPAARTESDA